MTEATRRRNSSFELLRIIIMFMILLLHANYATLGKPTNNFSFLGFGQNFAETLTIIPVNIFILITGYFGTSFKLHKVFQLLYQAFFCVVPITLIAWLFGISPSINSTFSLLKNLNFVSCYWFIVSYIAMLAFTPILNLAVERMTRIQLLSTLLIIYFFIGLGDYLHFFSKVLSNGGYSPLWFLELYLIGRYLRLNPLQLSRKALFLFYFLSALLCTVISIPINTLGLSYNNPFVVISSVAFFLIFTKVSFHNKLVNNIGTATTMVYLLNTHPIIWDFFQRYIFALRNTYSNIVIFVTALIISCIIFFFIAIAYDQLRQLSWRLFSPMSQRISKKIQFICENSK